MKSRNLFLGLLGVIAVGPLVRAETPDLPPRTVINSDTLEMQGTDERNYFYFRGDVHVTGNDLEIRCNELTVTAARTGGIDDTVGEIGAIESIIAQGDVEIQQAGRRAVAGRAEVDPVKGTVVLSDNPRLIDGEVEVEGYQFVFYRDDRRVQTIADPNPPPDRPGTRSRVTLGALSANVFDQPEESITVRERMGTLPPVQIEVPEAGSGEGATVSESEEAESPPEDAPAESTTPSTPEGDS